MSDDIVSMIVLIMRKYLQEKYNEYATFVSDLDHMNPKNGAELSYAYNHRKWRKWAMSGIKKAYSDCTVNTMRRRLITWGFFDESALSKSERESTTPAVLPFPQTDT